jgi:hypothetical protein
VRALCDGRARSLSDGWARYAAARGRKPYGVIPWFPLSGSPPAFRLNFQTLNVVTARNILRNNCARPVGKSAVASVTAICARICPNRRTFLRVSFIRLKRCAAGEHPENTFLDANFERIIRFPNLTYAKSAYFRQRRCPAPRISQPKICRKKTYRISRFLRHPVRVCVRFRSDGSFVKMHPDHKRAVCGFF